MSRPDVRPARIAAGSAGPTGATASRWRKSSYSGAGNDCVEVAVAAGSAAVRDSKDPSGGALEFGSACWAGFVSSGAITCEAGARPSD